jgi:hypothetical protein
MFLCMVFFSLSFLSFFFFFQNDLCWFYFSHFELVENFTSLFFSFKHCGLLQCFSTWFVFCYSVFQHVFFFKLSLSNIFFNIEVVENLALTFPTCFFSCFFLFFFQNYLLLFFFVFFPELFLSILFF